MNKYAIVGFGYAGYEAASAIRRIDPNALIDVYSDTELPPYNPMLITYFAKGDIAYKQMFPFGDITQIAGELKLNYRGVRVNKVIPGNMSLSVEHGETESYDGILISTGASPIKLPVPGIQNSQRIFTVRTVEDAYKLYELFRSGKTRKALVIGASMVGIKVAEGFLSHGIECTMVDAAPYIFPLAAFKETAERLMKRIDKAGIKQHYNASLKSVEELRSGLIAHFTDGFSLEADAIVLCVGTRPNIDIVRDTSIATNRGIIVDSRQRTNAPGIYAAGDCCESVDIQSGKHRVSGLWANAGNQGKTAGENMSGGCSEFNYNIAHNITHFLDCDFISAGDVSTCTEEDDIWEFDDGLNYIRAAKNGSLKCFNMIGYARLSGAIKSCLIKSCIVGRIKMDEMFAAILKSADFPSTFIDWISEKNERCFI